MNEPYLALYVKDGVLYFAKKLPTESKPREILEIDVAEVISNELDEAGRKIGITVLGILSLWHQDAFHGWGIPSQTDEEAEDEFDLALRLIHCALEGKTAMHNTSIEILLTQAATENDDARNYLKDAWPLLRDRLGAA